MLVFTIGCNVLTGQAVWGGISIACVLMVMVYSLAKSSGAIRALPGGSSAEPLVHGVL